MVTIIVFRTEDRKYLDQYGIERRATFETARKTLVVTDKTTPWTYYDKTFQKRIAVDENGLEYAEAIITDYGPSSKTWGRNPTLKKPKDWKPGGGKKAIFNVLDLWYERYSAPYISIEKQQGVTNR